MSCINADIIVLVALAALRLERRDTRNLQISRNIKTYTSMHLIGWLKRGKEGDYRANGKTEMMFSCGGWVIKILRDRLIYLILLEMDRKFKRSEEDETD